AVDFAAASFLIFGAIWWMKSLTRKDWRRTILAGAAFGFVLGSRYQGVVLVTWVVVGIIAAASIRDRKGVGGNFKKAVAAGAIAALMTLPWLVRNYSALGN